MIRILIKAVLILTIVMGMTVIPAISAENVKESRFRPSIQLEIGGATQLISFHLEGMVENVFGISTQNSLGLSAGIGLGFVAPSLSPIMVRSLFGEEHCAESGIGTLVQYREQPAKENWYASSECFNRIILWEGCRLMQWTSYAGTDSTAAKISL